VYPAELVSPAAIVKFFQLISTTVKGLTRVYAEPKIKFPSNLLVPFTSSFACRSSVPIPTLPLKYASQFPLKVIPVAPLALPLLVRIIFWIYCVALFIPGSIVNP